MDAVTGEHKRTLTGHTAGVMSIAFSPDSATLASGSWDGTVRWAVGYPNGRPDAAVQRAYGRDHKCSVQPSGYDGCQWELGRDGAAVGYPNRRTDAAVHRAYRRSYKRIIQSRWCDGCQWELGQ